MDIYEYSFRSSDDQRESSDEYIEGAKRTIEMLQKNIGLLEATNIPIFRREGKFVNGDYSNAERVGVTKIKLRGREIGIHKHGALNYQRKDTSFFIPQFYLDLRNEEGFLPIFLQHQTFFEDLEKMTFLIVEEEMFNYKLKGVPNKSWGSVEKVSDFFLQKGVPYNLIKELEPLYDQLKKEDSLFDSHNSKIL